MELPKNYSDLKSSNTENTQKVKKYRSGMKREVEAKRIKSVNERLDLTPRSEILNRGVEETIMGREIAKAADRSNIKIAFQGFHKQVFVYTDKNSPGDLFVTDDREQFLKDHPQASEDEAGLKKVVDMLKRGKEKPRYRLYNVYYMSTHDKTTIWFTDDKEQFVKTCGELIESVDKQKGEILVHGVKEMIETGKIPETPLSGGKFNFKLRNNRIFGYLKDGRFFITDNQQKFVEENQITSEHQIAEGDMLHLFSKGEKTNYALYNIHYLGDRNGVHYFYNDA